MRFNVKIFAVKPLSHHRQIRFSMRVMVESIRYVQRLSRAQNYNKTIIRRVFVRRFFFHSRALIQKLFA